MDKLVQKKKKKSGENGFQRFYSVKLKKSEENKFLYVYFGVLENEGKKMDINFFFLVFSSPVAR